MISVKNRPSHHGPVILAIGSGNKTSTLMSLIAGNHLQNGVSIEMLEEAGLPVQENEKMLYEITEG